jgi:hypothetical protein
MSIDVRLGDYVRLTEFANMVGKTRRTLSRWINQPDGLPYLRLGREIHVPLAHARDWLASRIRRPNPRRRGR